MQHFTKSQMQSARKANLYDYLMCNHLSDCIKDGNSLRPKCNHSISEKKGMLDIRILLRVKQEIRLIFWCDTWDMI